jgi:hypothetical protein
MKKYFYYAGIFIAVISNINGTLSFINSLMGENMTLKDFETIVRIILTFGILSFLGWMYYNFKAKLLALKKYNEERFDITIKALKTQFIQDKKEHDEIGKAIKTIKPETEITEGKDQRVTELWDKIKADFDKVQKEYDNEFKKWVEPTA